MAMHHQNQDVVKRLKRANGHLAKVVAMVESNAPCLDVAQQLQAVTSAVVGAKKVYIQDHIEHCLSDARSEKMFDAKLKEFKEITKYI
ncbi:MAG: nickel resistance protein [Bdellovibrionaceae bacterium]|nr:nickel resistance protein [Pseudobdellovibrionaceae bacterium]|tara:strand:- start:1225 stop:1488 length:264 start_codon:yes stop_codon:yes gene_type:complete